MGEFLSVVTSPVIDAKLAQEGKKFEVGEFVQDFANTFETLVDPSKYVRDLTEDEKVAQAMAMQAQAQASGMPQTPITSEQPQEEAMAQGIEQSI